MFLRSLKYNFILLIAVVTFSCKEIYNPDLVDPHKALVVDALITDENKAHSIRISRAIRYDSLGYLPEREALVFITDENGNSFFFKENSPGYYLSDPVLFKTNTGSIYTLTIQTKEGKIYKSSEQILLPMKAFGEVTNIRQNGGFPNVVGNKLVFLRTYGAEIFTSVDINSDPHPFYRYSNSILAEYEETIDPKEIIYCWQKFYPNVVFNLIDNQYLNSGIIQHDLGFYPVDTTFYGITLQKMKMPNGALIVIKHKLDKYVVSFKQYRLNKEIFEYYKSLNNQLEAKQQIFDPIAFQSLGNIKCITHPESLILGVFEVSSVSILTFRIEPNQRLELYNLIPIPPVDMDTIPGLGKSTDVKPSTWIY